jgi:tRNA pseudouridine55 synthase
MPGTLTDRGKERHRAKGKRTGVMGIDRQQARGDAECAGRAQSPKQGILVVDKPSGVTSRFVVDAVARAIPHAKVGHCGTLDPLASGILILCVGVATRLVEAIQRLSKSYRTVIRLGARSNTLDADGRIEDVACPSIPSAVEVAQALSVLSGRVLQRPPAFSALKIEGKRAYDLARAGRQVELAPRLVQIDQIVVARYEWPDLELQIDCASGTYIRSIARDAGELLGSAGYVKTLVRTRVGPFALDQAVGLEALSAADSLFALLRPMIEAVPDLPRIVLTAPLVESVAFGRRFATADVNVPVEAGEVALLSEDGQLVALGRCNLSEGWIQPCKVFVVPGPLRTTGTTGVSH